VKKALILIGGEYHDFEANAETMAAFLRENGVCDCKITSDRKALTRLSPYDLVIIYASSADLTPAQEKALCEYVRAGGGLLGVHTATVLGQGNPDYMEMIGGRFITHGPITNFEVNLVGDHEITRRMDGFRITDEFYIMEKKTRRYEVLANAQWHGKIHPMVYVRPYGKGRVCYIALGHDQRAFGTPQFQKLVCQGARWVSKQAEAKPVRCAIVGYGGAFNMGKHHADQIRRVGLEVTAVCDLDAGRLEIAREEQGEGVALYQKLEDLAADPNVDLAVVITPHNVHARNALLLLNAGKHVITEKPFCITAEEATAMIEAARAKGLMLTTYHNRRWDQDFVTIRQIIAEGLIGEVFHIEAYAGGYSHPGYWWRSDKRVSGGAIYDWGAHFMDWILNLMPGKIESVYGFYHKRVWHDVTNEDQCQAILRFEGGRYAELQQSSIAATGKSKWRILGTKGAINATWESPVHVTTFVNGRQESLDVPHLPADWLAYYRNIADHLLTGAPLAVTPESARRVIAVLEYAEKSAKCGMPLEVPYE
jgi:predicted dehydrogenase/type 1 glutamine amidotransferase